MDERFNENTMRFLIELKMRNDRDWYYSHKPEYERYVLKPFQALVKALTPSISHIDPQIETIPAIGKTISRVYRDARFTHDKSLYRDRAWITFERKIDSPDVPAFYFELMPSGYRYGVGFYNVTVKTMEEYRAMIDSDENGFLQMINAVTKDGSFAVEGDLYKRNRYNGTFEEISDWYNRRNIYIAANRSDISEVYDFDALVTRLKNGFATLAGIYYFWCKAASI